MMKQTSEKGTSLLYSLIAQARGYSDAIVLGRGDPDFDTPPQVVATACDAMRTHANDYCPPEGLPVLRKAIAERVKRVNRIDVDPETEVVVTNGGQEALFLMVLTVAGPEAEILVPEPNYNTYDDALRFAHARKVGVPTFPAENFRVDPDRVRAATTARTKGLLHVSPNNPAASVISPVDSQELVNIANEHALIILADDIYDLFVYEDVVHTSPASLPGGKERTLTLNALSKSMAMTGWRLGWVVGPAHLMVRVKQLKAAVTGGTSVMSQYAGLAALTGSQEPLRAMRDTYARRRHIVLGALDRMGISYGLPQGGQFVFADISFTGMDSAEVARRILTEQHVLVYPGSAFSQGSENYLRITFLQPEDKLLEGLQRMEQVMRTIGRG